MRIGFGLALFLASFPVSAFGQVIINEIAWMGAPVEGVASRQEWRHEWLELHNAGEEAVALEGWRVELYRGEGERDFVIALQGEVEPGGYALVGASANIPDVDVNYGTLAGKFVNSGQRVVLKNAAGEVAEEVDARSGWFAGDNGSKLTMERRFVERPASDEDNWGSSQRIGGTPKAQNSVFGQERFRVLEGKETEMVQQKKASLAASVFRVVGNPVFLLAFTIALGSALAMVLLRRYLLRAEPSEGSSDVRRD